MKLKLPYGLKIGLAITALAVGATGTSLYMFFESTRSMMLKQMGNRLEDIGQSSRYLFDEHEIESIQMVKGDLQKQSDNRTTIMNLLKPGSYAPSISTANSQAIEGGKDFQSLVTVLRKIKNATKRWVSGAGEAPETKATITYAALLTTITESPDRSVLQFISDADYDKPGFENPVGQLFRSNSMAIRNAFGGEVGSDTDFRLEQGEYLFTAAIPIFDADRKVIAVLTLDYDAKSEANFVQGLRRVCELTVIASFALSILIAMLLARVLNRPLRVLRDGAERVRRRDFSARIDLDSNDELGLLATTFNSMVEEIRQYAHGLETLNAAYYRFVPKQFLDQLGQKSIVDVKLGDQVQRQMTVLFSDIRSFTTISEAMSPRDNFDFINEYLRTVSPIIRAHGGFIDKYVGDAIMALFPENADQAVKAAVAMQQALTTFNVRQRDMGRPPIKIGIGLHNGHLMLGTVGEEERMEGTVISDAVNLASRLEGLTKEYGAPLIVSEKVHSAVQEISSLHSRYLGRVKVKGKTQAIGIFEIIEGEDEDLARRKIITIQEFEAGVKAFELGNRELALISFEKVLAISPGDIASQLFVARCKMRFQRPGFKPRMRRLYSVKRKPTGTPET